MAKCYGDLVMELWSGTQKNVAPLKLRVKGLFHSCLLMKDISVFVVSQSAMQTETLVSFSVASVLIIDIIIFLIHDSSPFWELNHYFWCLCYWSTFAKKYNL